MTSLSSILPIASGVVVGAGGTVAFFFVKGYFQQAGSNLADKTPVLKSETVNRAESKNNQEIIEKLDNLRREKETLREQKEGEIEDYESELSDYERIIESIQDESVARKRLIESYWKPLHALVACFTKSKVETEDGKENFVLETLRNGRDVEQITGSTYIVPPKDVPEQIKGSPDSREAIEEWVEEEVYSDHPDAMSHIGMLGLVDLRNVYSSSDYEQDELPHFFSTVDREFDLEDIFNSEDFSRLLANQSVNLTEIIEEGDIAFFVSNAVSSEELSSIQANQEKVQKELGNPNVKELANIADSELIDALEPYISNPSEVAESVKDEADIWVEQLYE